MEASFATGAFANSDVVLRLVVATGAGLLLGLDRELRGLAAGIRTHALVSLSSAVVTVSALMLFNDLRGYEGADVDPLRVVQGLAQAIGFIAAGTIIISKGDVHNLTTAANVWLASSVGIVAGAGQLFLVVVTIGLGIVIISLVRLAERFIPGSDKAGKD